MAPACATVLGGHGLHCPHDDSSCGENATPWSLISGTASVVHAKWKLSVFADAGTVEGLKNAWKFSTWFVSEFRFFLALQPDGRLPPGCMFTLPSTVKRASVRNSSGMLASSLSSLPAKDSMAWAHASRLTPSPWSHVFCPAGARASAGGGLPTASLYMPCGHKLQLGSVLPSHGDTGCEL